MCPNTILLKMKLRYYEMVNQFSKNSNQKNIFTRSWINNTIENLLHIKDMTEAQKEAHTNLIQNYEIKIKNGRKVLTKLAPDKKRMDEIVPLEDSFETALYAHVVTGHGSAYHIILWLEENGYIMANLCVPIVRQVCSEMSKECVPNKTDSVFLPLLKDLIAKEPELCDVARQTNEKTSERAEITEKLPCDIDKTIASSDDKVLNTNKHRKDKDVDETSAKQRKIAHETNDNDNILLKPTTARINYTSQITKDDHTKQNKTKKASEKSKAFKGTYALPPPDFVKPDLLPAAMISLKNMHHLPDSEFKLLLVYKDFETEFVQLRPLTQKHLNKELTMELFKIFCDFSIPKCIVVSSILKETFEVILNDMKNILEHNIVLKISKFEVTGDTIFFVVRKLRNWILTMGDSWSVGCHAVQWEMNSMHTKGGSTPYKRFFGIKRVKNMDKGNEKLGEQNPVIGHIETNRKDITAKDDRDQCDNNSKPCKTSSNATPSNVHNRLSTIKQGISNSQNSHDNLNIANDYMTNKFKEILQTSSFNKSRELSKESNSDQSIHSNLNSELNHNVHSSVVSIQSKSKLMPVESYVIEVIQTVPDPIIIKTEDDLPISTETLIETNNFSHEKCNKYGNENINRVENKIEKLHESIDFAHIVNYLPNINKPESSVQLNEFLKTVPDPIKIKSEDDFSNSIEEVEPTGTENINIREDRKNMNVNNIINRLKFDIMNFAGSPEPKSSHNENVTKSIVSADTNMAISTDIPMTNSTKTFDFLYTDEEFVDLSETDTNAATVHDGQANRGSVKNINIIQETPKLV